MSDVKTHDSSPFSYVTVLPTLRTFRTVALSEILQRLDLHWAGDWILDGGEWHYCVIVASTDVGHCMERNKFPDSVIHLLC